jgi:hypothetical protein
MRSETPSWKFLRLMALGAVSFWLPDTLWHAVIGLRDVPGLLALAVPTLSMPLALLGMYLFLKRQPTNGSQHNIGLPLMLGVWTLGGLFMAIGASFQGGGFVGPDGTRGAIEMILIAVLPMYTFVMATYDTSLGALIVATIGAVLISFFPPKRLRSQ